MTWFEDLRFGDVATWLTMVATIAAVVAAVSAGRWARAVVEIERDRDERHEQESRAQQASQVAAWAEPAVVKPERRESSGFSWMYTAVAVNGLIANRSSQPIYKLSLEWYKEGELLLTNFKPVVAPGHVAVCALESSQVLDIADVPEEQGEAVAFDFHSATTLSELAVSKLLLAVRFTDSANRSWYRDRDGTLTEL
jgi:hypothetical protein